MTIYPEAHIWPYCNFIRDYPYGSFMYPKRLTYRRSALPLPVAAVGCATRDELRDRIHGFMTDTVNSNGSYEYIAYRKKDDTDMVG